MAIMISIVVYLEMFMTRKGGEGAYKDLDPTRFSIVLLTEDPELIYLFHSSDSKILFSFFCVFPNISLESRKKSRFFFRFSQDCLLVPDLALSLFTQIL